MKTVKLLGVGLVAAAVLLLAGPAKAAVSVVPESGSVFNGWVLSAGTNTWSTNAFYLAPGTSSAAFTTNLASDVLRAVPISGAAGVEFWLKGVQSNAGGATNNGAATFVIQTSPDLVLWASNSVVTFPSVGVTAGTYSVRVTADSLGSPAYFRVYSASHTNIGPTYFSNFTYRVLRTLSQ